MKTYKVCTANTPEDAELQMNDLAQQGWSVTAVTFWQTVMRYQLVLTFEREA